jgi:leucyl aminopeptidase (aminopeptidase T)
MVIHELPPMGQLHFVIMSPPYVKNTVRPCETQHNATQRNATQRNATQRNATQRNATQRNATQRNATQRNATQHNTTQHNTTQHNTTQHNTTQQDFWDLVVEGLDQNKRRGQLNWLTAPQMREAKLPDDQYLG